ncbi:MAG: substrate-binding domain-containing protein [Lacipirellulaceae bacterium]
MSENTTSGGKWGLILLALIAIGAAAWYRSSVTVDPIAKGNKTTRAVFVTGGSDDFWKLTAKGAEAAAKEHNVELEVKMPSQAEGADEQMRIMIALQDSEIDGCAVSPLDADSQTRLINRLSDKMHVVTFDSDAPLSERLYYVGTSNFRAGRIAHKLVREAVPDGGKVAVFISNLTKSNTKERKLGYEEAEVKANQKVDNDGDGPNWETVVYAIDEGSEAKTKENLAKALEENPDLDCVVGMNGYHGALLLQALKEAGKLGELKIIAFDAAEETLDGVAEGNIHATIAQDPYLYGYEAVRMLASLHNGHESQLPLVGGGAVNVLTQAIGKDDVEGFREKLKKRLNGTATKAAESKQESEAA